MSRPDDLNKIERGEQRIKKYTQAQKKLHIGNSTSTSTTASASSSSTIAMDSTTTSSSHHSDSNDDADGLLFEWTTKSSAQSLVKEEVRFN